MALAQKRAIACGSLQSKVTCKVVLMWTLYHTCSGGQPVAQAPVSQRQLADLIYCGGGAIPLHCCRNGVAPFARSTLWACKLNQAPIALPTTRSARLSLRSLWSRPL